MNMEHSRAVMDMSNGECFVRMSKSSSFIIKRLILSDEDKITTYVFIIEGTADLTHGKQVQLKLRMMAHSCSLHFSEKNTVRFECDKSSPFPETKM